MESCTIVIHITHRHFDNTMICREFYHFCVEVINEARPATPISTQWRAVLEPYKQEPHKGWVIFSLQNLILWLMTWIKDDKGRLPSGIFYKRLFM